MSIPVVNIICNCRLSWSFISNVCIGSADVTDAETKRENARQNVSWRSTQTLSPSRLSQHSHIYLWCKQTIKRENYERSRSLRSARPWWLRCVGNGSAAAAQQQRSGWVAAEQRLHDINHAHAHKFTMSLALSRLPCALCLACTTGTGIAPSRSQCFIAAGYALLLASSSCARTHTGTHTGALRHSAHSLRAKGRRKKSESERERAAVYVSNIC